MLALALTSACSTATAPARTQVTWVSVSAGLSHTCALTAGGAAYCWGSDAYGQLGVAVEQIEVRPYFPRRVAGGQFASLSAGALHTCGLDGVGAAWCWGSNQHGQLGTGTLEGPVSCGVGGCAYAPVRVSGGLVFREIRAGSDFTCALTAVGMAYCWGADSVGQLGGGATEAPDPSPTLVAGGLRFRTLATGDEHACGLTDAGRVYCWGRNRRGQVGPEGRESCPVGDLVYACSTAPVPAGGGRTFAAVTAGGDHSCGLAVTGPVYCWGDDGEAQIGATPTDTKAACQVSFLQLAYTCSPDPVRVPGGLALHDLAAGGVDNCGLTAAGDAWCWGGNYEGQLGDCTVRGASPEPRKVCGDHVFADLDVGTSHACAVTRGGAAWCWGGNDAGELGSAAGTSFGPQEVVDPLAPPGT